MRVIKRNGEYEDVSFDKVLNRIRILSKDLNVEIYEITQKVCSRIYDLVKTSELDELAAQICSSMIVEHPDYGTLASRITVSNHHKNTSPSFSETIAILYGNRVHDEHCPLITTELYELVMKNKEKLNNFINYERDYSFDFFGMKTLERSYLLRVDNKIVERPQHMFMRVALGIHTDDLKEALQTYDYMSKKFFTHATPTLFNAGTLRPQLSSCYLYAMPADSLEGIMDCLKDCSMISKYAGGIGLHVHNIRAKGSRIRSTNGTSDGLVPMLKVFNHLGRYVNQCFTPDTMVFCNKGCIAMADIQVGDRMLTMNESTGVPEFKSVLGVSVKEICEPILEIKSALGTKSVRVTKVHELYVRRGEDEPEFIAASDLKVGDHMGYPEKDGFFWSPITSIDEVDYEGLVYDLNMEDNHNYVVVNLGLVHNSGKRNGSIAIYLENWHSDVYDFIDLKKNHGNEEDRARDLFYALWISDLFMTRVREGKMWSLMCPDKCPGLCDVYGDEFVELYERYEAEGKYTKQVPAQDLWFKIMEGLIETGGPFLLFKDAANKKSNQKNIGVIKSSNLCVAEDTMILTSTGYHKIKDLSGKEVEVWNGSEFSKTKVLKTGENQKLLRIEFDNGMEIKCTPYHKFYIDDAKIYEAKDLSAGMKILPYRMPGAVDNIHVYVKNVVDEGEFGDTYCFNEPKKHMGIFNGILTGNCTEIMEVSTPDETAVCNLASICLPTYINNDKFDFDKLHEITMLVTKNLNKIIDINFYPIVKARKSNLRHRPIGIGIQGLADTYMIMGYPYDSPEAAELNKKIFETIYHAAVEASMLISKKRHEMISELHGGVSASREVEIKKYLNLNEFETIDGLYPGAYSTFEGSPASEGKLQFDLWDANINNQRYDWDALKADVKKYGMRNSLLLAPMPTASTSQIMGFTESFECITSNLYKRKTLAGEFIVVNKYLMKDLIKANLWNKQIQQKIMLGEGSIQHIQEIPENLRALYKTVWELSQKVVIDQAADRGVFICQSQSLNLFQEAPTFQSLSSMLFYSWSVGLKTGSYYIRTKPKAKTQSFTVDVSLENQFKADKKKTTRPRECTPNEDGSCAMCQG